MMRELLLISFISLSFSASQARAGDIAALLYGSPAEGLSTELVGGGHAAILLPTLCAEGPYKLRKCNADEAPGVVVSRYAGVGTKDDPKDWMVVPAFAHFFGVDKQGDVPLFTGHQVADVVRDDYYLKHLTQAIPTEDGKPPKNGSWRVMLGSSYERPVWALHMQTSAEEDEKLLKSFNEDPNRAQFNFFLNNCSDFARRTINSVMPGAAKKWVVPDMGMTSPKAVFGSVADYGKKHPERMMVVEKVTQQPGVYPPGLKARSAMETAYLQKKYLLPLAYYHPYILLTFTGLSQLKRMDPDKLARQFPSLEVAKIRDEMDELKKQKEELEGCEECRKGKTVSQLDEMKKQIDDISKAIDEKDSTLKSKLKYLDEEEKKESAFFDEMRAKYRVLVSKAAQAGKLTIDEAKILAPIGDANKFFRQFEQPPYGVRMDSQRGLLLEQKVGDKTVAAGMTFDNVEKEDKGLGFRVMMGRMNYLLDAKNPEHVPVEDLKANWTLLERLTKAVGIQ